MSAELTCKKDRIINICFERYGQIEPFMIEDIKLKMGNNEIHNHWYIRVKKVTYQDIDKDEDLLAKHPDCGVCIK